MRSGWVYIMTNRPNGTLYVGVTSDLIRRVNEHREGRIEGFTKRYGVKRLVYAEPHEEISAAIYREKIIKHWTRAQKVRLILAENPDWLDLYEPLLEDVDARASRGHDELPYIEKRKGPSNGRALDDQDSGADYVSCTPNLLERTCEIQTRIISTRKMITPNADSCMNEPLSHRSKMITAAVRFSDRDSSSATVSSR